MKLGEPAQRILRSTGKTDVPPFPHDRGNNVLEKQPCGGSPQIFKRHEPENVLELARGICLLANAGMELRQGFGRRWAAQADALLREWGWRREMAETESRWLHMGSAGAIAGSLEPDQLVAEELSDLANQLSDFIAGAESGEQFITTRAVLEGWRVNRETGRFESEPVAALGPCQDVLSRVLPKIEAHRLARCVACQCFFYKPRLSSQACSRKCENVLMSRRHYYREKEHRERALELLKQGESVSVIARALCLKPDRVRRYLTANRQEK